MLCFYHCYFHIQNNYYSKITYFYWFIMIFFFNLKKFLLSDSSIFNCFIFFLLFKKTSHFLNFFFCKFFSHIKNCLKTHQLNIIKITKKDYKKAGERYQTLSKKGNEKKSDNMKRYKTEKIQNSAVIPGYENFLSKLNKQSS